jgi:allophanate hydrolase
VDAFKGRHELRRLAHLAAAQWERMDVLVVPTAGRCYTLADVERDPVGPNRTLGYYTNFVNLLDLCAVAVPSGFQGDGLPFGLTLIGPAGADGWVLDLGGSYHRATGLPLGATGCRQPDRPAAPEVPTSAGRVQLAVVGAHLSGQPLNDQLTDRGAVLVRACRTSSTYRLYALPGTAPPKPGLIRSAAGNGSASSPGIEVEVWEMTAEAFGTFVAAIPPPLGVGTVELEDGTHVKSFLCEGYAVAGARDITQFGGWRAYLGSLSIAADRGNG